MNKVKRIIAVAATLLFILLLTDVATAAHPYHKYNRHGWRSAAYAPPPVSVSFQVFYDNLAPYGSWINDPIRLRMGAKCWQRVQAILY